MNNILMIYQHKSSTLHKPIISKISHLTCAPKHKFIPSSRRINKMKLYQTNTNYTYYMNTKLTHQCD